MHCENSHSGSVNNLLWELRLRQGLEEWLEVNGVPGSSSHVCVWRWGCVWWGRGLPHTHKDTWLVSDNSTQFWHCLPGDGIKFQRLRVQFHKTAPSPHFRYHSQAQVITCASHQVTIDCRFQQPPPRTSDARYKSRLFTCTFNCLAVN